MAKPVTGLTVFENNTTNSLVNLDNNFTSLQNAVNDPGSYTNYAVDAGAVNSLSITLTNYSLSAYADGQIYAVKVAVTNTGAATLNVNSLGTKTIYRKDGSALQAGDLIATNIYQFLYNSSLASSVGGFNLEGSLPLGLNVSAAGNVSIPAPASGAPFSVTGEAGQPAITATATAGSGSSAAKLVGAAYTPTIALTFGATTTIDCSTSNVFRVVLTGNITTLTVNNPSDGQTMHLRLKQGGAGSFTIAWPASFRWPGGSVPILSTAVNSIDLLTAGYDATDATWVCTLLKGVQ